MHGVDKDNLAHAVFVFEPSSWRLNYLENWLSMLSATLVSGWRVWLWFTPFMLYHFFWAWIEQSSCSRSYLSALNSIWWGNWSICMHWVQATQLMAFLCMTQLQFQRDPLLLMSQLPTSRWILVFILQKKLKRWSEWELKFLCKNSRDDVIKKGSNAIHDVRHASKGLQRQLARGIESQCVGEDLRACKALFCKLYGGDTFDEKVKDTAAEVEEEGRKVCLCPLSFWYF